MRLKLCHRFFQHSSTIERSVTTMSSPVLAIYHCHSTRTLLEAASLPLFCHRFTMAEWHTLLTPVLCNFLYSSQRPNLVHVSFHIAQRILASDIKVLWVGDRCHNQLWKPSHGSEAYLSFEWGNREGFIYQSPNDSYLCFQMGPSLFDWSPTRLVDLTP